MIGLKIRDVLLGSFAILLAKKTRVSNKNNKHYLIDIIWHIALHYCTQQGFIIGSDWYWSRQILISGGVWQGKAQDNEYCATTITSTASVDYFEYIEYLLGSPMFHYTLSYHESTLQGFTLEEEWMLMLGFNSNDDPASINSSNYSFRPILFNATKWNQLVWRWSARRRHSRTSNFYEKRKHRSQAIEVKQS